MLGPEFHVDPDELRRIARTLGHAREDLREQCERMPHHNIDIGASTGAVDAAIIALLGAEAEVLDTVTRRVDALDGTREEYVRAEEQNLAAQRRIHDLDALFVPTHQPRPGLHTGHPATERP